MNPRLHAMPMAIATAIAVLLGALASSGCVPVEMHWFRRGDAGGSPGGVLTFERSIPEW